MKIRIDTSLVVPWSLELVQNEPFDYPLMVRYRLGNKRLAYIASLHSPRSDSPTFELIRRTLEQETFDLLIVEGIEHSAGISAPHMIHWASTQGKNGVYEGFESAFSISLAHKSGIPFVGGEPDETAILSKMELEEYTFEEVVFCEFVQRIFQSNQRPAITEDEAVALFADRMVKKNQVEGSRESLSFSRFLEWYRKNNGADFSTSAIHEEVLAPIENGKLLTQRISASICKLRDRFILERLGLAFETHDSVLVIYGGSHWSTQRISLENALGLPSFTKG